MGVTLVVTEHSEALSRESHAHYETVRARIEQAAGTAVATVQYEDVSSLDGAEAVVLSGSFAPWATHPPGALERLGEVVRAYEGPVLGICAGMQLQARFEGGSVGRSLAGPMAGFGAVDVVEADGLFRGLPARFSVYEHHGDEIEQLPPCFRVLARSETCGIEAIAHTARPWWGTQFHPEDYDEKHPLGERILHNFFVLARSA